MSDLLRQGSDFLEHNRHAHMSSPIEYVRAGVSVEIDATVGRTIFEQQDQFGILQRTESRDYLIRAQDLVFDGVQVEPTIGDKVREVSSSHTLIYEVMAPGGEPLFRFSDPQRSTLRIHTKLVGLETPT